MLKATEIVHVDPATGSVSGARLVPSPNQDARPAHTDIDLIVIHNISLPPGQFGGDEIEALFTNTLECTAHPYFERLQGLRVSAHLLIRRDGTLLQFVPLHRRAWHAGESSFEGREQCNDYSIGIELEGGDEIAYESVQMERLAALLRALMQAYPGVSPDRIVGHSDIAASRKTDPGAAFDWADLRRRLGSV